MNKQVNLGACPICNRTVQLQHARISGKNIYFGGKKSSKAHLHVHLLCWQIRQQQQPDRLKNALSHVVSVSGGPTGATNSYLLRDDAISNKASDNALRICEICSEQSREGKIFVWLHDNKGNNTNNPLCFACYCVRYNARSKLALTKKNAEMAVLSWTGLPQTTTVVKRSVVLDGPSMEQKHQTETAPYAPGASTTAPSATAFDAASADVAYQMFLRVSPTDLMEAFAGSEYTVVKRLAEQITKSDHNITMPFEFANVGSPLVFMKKCEYRARDMVRMGLTFEMLFKNINKEQSEIIPEDWFYVLDKINFPVHVLMDPGLNATFTRMILSGMDLQMFVNANYTTNELKAMGFNFPAFLAAAGTREEAASIFKLQDIKQLKDPENYGYSKDLLQLI
jgi:hypothetical protein